MLASRLISNVLSPIRTSDTGEEVITIMNVFHVKHLPIVNNKELLGVISEDDILSNNLEESIGSYHLTMNRAYAKEEDHVFEVMSQMAEYNLTVIPVINTNGEFSGLISMEELLQFYASSFSFIEPGSILVIEMNKHDYSLAEISRIIELEKTQVLCSFITRVPEHNEILLTLKLNSQDIQHVLATLKRYEYHVKASFTEDIFHDNLRDHYDSLMNYLNV
jgi:acetoin utilization protein AcuB